MLEFSNYSKSKGKMKAETADEVLELKPKIYSYLVNGYSEHKKAKGLNKNIVATISHIKDVFLIKND